jgi:hypothetical protein
VVTIAFCEPMASGELQLVLFFFHAIVKRPSRGFGCRQRCSRFSDVM